jgi:hypothetical protein
VIRFRFAPLALCLLLVACKDTRRDLAQSHVRAHPPEGFEIVAAPADIPIKDSAAGEAGALTNVRYRLLRSTIEKEDGFALPRGRELAGKLTALRGWALGALPAEDPLRKSMLETVAQARAPFPVKRIVTPAGTELDALVDLKLRKAGNDWKVVEFAADASVPGAPDTDATIPFEDAPEVAARLDQIAGAVRELETTRQTYLAERARRGEESLARLRERLQAGRTFEGILPDGSQVRFVISRGLDGEDGAIVVVTVRTPGGESTARFSGGPVQQPSGETAWRAAQVTTLSVSQDGAASVTNAAARPVLTLVSRGDLLDARWEMGDRPPVTTTLHGTEPVDLIPDPAAVPASR